MSFFLGGSKPQTRNHFIAGSKYASGALWPAGSTAAASRMLCTSGPPLALSLVPGSSGFSGVAEKGIWGRVKGRGDKGLAISF